MNVAGMGMRVMVVATRPLDLRKGHDGLAVWRPAR